MNLIDRMDKYLLNRERRGRENHYPSDANSCTRQLYYKWKQAPESNPCEAGMLYKMEMGNSIHTLVHHFLKESGLDIKEEVAFKVDIPGLKQKISGRIDNVFIDENGKDSGIEIKTTFGRGVAEIARSRSPKLDHLTQVLIYLHCTHIDKFYLVYIGRDNAYRCQFVLEKKGDKIYQDGKEIPLSFENVIDKFKRIETALESTEVPAKEYRAIIKNNEIKDKVQCKGVITKSDWQCLYCNYRNECWKEELK